MSSSLLPHIHHDMGIESLRKKEARSTEYIYAKAGKCCLVWVVAAECWGPKSAHELGVVDRPGKM